MESLIEKRPCDVVGFLSGSAHLAQRGVMSADVFRGFKSTTTSGGAGDQLALRV